MHKGEALSTLQKMREHKQTNNNMKPETKALLDSFLPKMTPTQQKQMLQQLVKQANEDSRKQAISDPLSRVPRA